MVGGFSKKKIRLRKKSLGEIFRSERLKKEVSLSEVESVTKVRTKYLEAIENSNWKDLPQKVYVRGFVLAYAKYLNLNIEEIVGIYNTESFIQQNSEQDRISYNQTFTDKKILVTPKLIAYSLLTTFVLAIFTYISFQVLSFTGAPNLDILSPGGNVATEENEIKLAGITDIDTYVVVNNENVPVTSDGKFETLLKLQRGVNIIKVKAVNKANKETAEVFTVEYKPKTASVDKVK